MRTTVRSIECEWIKTDWTTNYCNHDPLVLGDRTNGTLSFDLVPKRKRTWKRDASASSARSAALSLPFLPARLADGLGPRSVLRHSALTLSTIRPSSVSGRLVPPR